MLAVSCVVDPCGACAFVQVARVRVSSPAMRSPRLSWESITLKLRNPFRVSYGTSETRQAFVLALAGDEGVGEGTIPPYYQIDAAAMIAYWQRVAASDVPFPDEVGEIAAWVPEGPAPARSAVDLVLFDRLAKRQAAPLYKFLGLPKPPALATSFT